MLKKSFVIENKQGLHVRPAGVLVKAIKDFDSSIKINHNDKIIEAKSLLGIMGACIKCGDTIEFQVDGSDEKEAMKAIEEVIESGLGE